jgi:hypothetical protein
LEVGAPVAGVHVADADQDGGTNESPPLLPETGLVMGHGDGTVYAFERGVADSRSFAEIAQGGAVEGGLGAIWGSVVHLVVRRQAARGHYRILLRSIECLTGHA